MFESFTEHARRLVVMTQQAAVSRDDTYIGTEHFLLALLDDAYGVGPRALQSLGVDPAAVRGAIRSSGESRSVEPGHLPFTPSAKAVLERAVLESQERGHPEIDTPHVLYALASIPNCTAETALGECGVDAKLLQDCAASYMR